MYISLLQERRNICFFVSTCSSKKKERRNFTIPFDSKSHYKFTGINTSIFLADISWKSWIPILPFCRFPRCTLLPIPPFPLPPIHIPMLNNISLFTHFLPFVSSASPLYLFLHPTFLSSFLLVFLLSFFFYLISIHSTEYTFLRFFHSNHFYFYTRSLRVPSSLDSCFNMAPYLTLTFS